MSMTAKWNWMCVAGGGLMLAAAVCGCAEKNDRGLVVRTVNVASFAPGDKPIHPAAPSPAVAAAPNATATTAPVPVAHAAAATQPTPGTPPATAPAANAAPARLRPGELLTNPGDQIVIDSLVGQVSGRPIFADALLEPVADQLRREAERAAQRGDFNAQAGPIVTGRLRDVVLTELFMAEAESSLTPQQQQGLFALLRNLQEKTIATGMGSRALTEQRLQAEHGESIEQYTERERSILLIGNLLNTKIEPRVIVSWKDVQREYQRRKAEFNPPATVTLRRIRLSNTEKPEMIEQVKSRLGGGEAFESVAEAAGETDGGLWDTFTMGAGGVSDIEINEAFKPALDGLSAGQSTQPIELEGRTVWLHVASITQPPQRTLYDVQRELIEQLTQRRRDEERTKYIKRLLEKGIYDQLDEMSLRVLTVASARYGK